jgi:hypothetical protein
MAYNTTDNGLDLNFDVDPEERKRRLAMMAGLAGGAPITDVAAQQLDQRFAPIQQMIESPEEAARKRLGMQSTVAQPVQPTEAIMPGQPQMPDETSAETQRLLQQNQIAQGVPTQQPPTSVDLSPEAQQEIQKTAQQMAPTGPAVPTVEREQEQPTVAPTGAVNPNEVVQQVNQTMLPKAGEPVQVAGPTVVPPPPVPQWSQDITNAQGDLTKLHAIAGNNQYPEDARKLAGELTAKMYKGKIEEEKANNTINKAFTGQDPKAMNQVMSDLRKSTSEGSYLKAILYQRLGLGELAKEEQQKLGAGAKIGQSMIDGKQYTVEYDGQGGVKRAWNSEGVRMEDKELAKISAGGIKPGTHAFGFTGESVTIPQGDPNAGQEYRQRTNSITGQVENVISTGPNAGKIYTGSPGFVKSVQTAAAKIDYGLGADLYKKHSGNVLDMLKEYEMIKGPQSPEGRQAFLTQYGYNQTVNQPSLPGTPATGAPAGAVQPSQVTPQSNVVTNRPQPNVQTVQTVQGGAPVVSAPITTTATPGVGGRVAGGVSGQGISGMKAQQEIGVAGAKENIQVQGQRAQSFNKHIDETITPEAVNGDTVSSLRKQQFNLFNRPDVDPSKIFGIANGVGQAPGDQRWTMFRDVLLGKVSEPADEIRQRAAQLGLNPSEQSAVAEYAIANAEINAKTLKSTAGPGSVSDAEQAANRQRNVDVTKIPMLGGYNAMAQSQFNADLAKYKGDWSVNSKASNTAQLESEWRKEKQKITNSYIDIAKQRLDYISKNGNSSVAIKQGYTFYPVPTYDNVTNTWSIKKPLSEILGK